jgi:hypothetical protein
MLGSVLAGLYCWDESATTRRRPWAAAGWAFLALGIAAKVTAAILLVPLALVITRKRPKGELMLALSTLGPALFWYAWANHLIESGTGSRASAESRAIWMTVVGTAALLQPQTLGYLWRYLCVRAFTPPGLLLGVWGLCRRGLGADTQGIDLWSLWALSAVAVLVPLAGKLHHEYYWLLLAPALAAGMGRACAVLARRHMALACAFGLLFVGSSAYLVRSTWQTPPEWEHLEAAARAVADCVPPDDWLVAPEPLLYHADRRGCRLEYTPSAAARAAAEWPQPAAATVGGPLDLIEFYRSKGARFVADLVQDPQDQDRKALHESIRQRYKVRVDRASVLIAELNPAEIYGHGQ